jgi:hypothetical protein
MVAGIPSGIPAAGGAAVSPGRALMDAGVRRILVTATDDRRFRD